MDGEWMGLYRHQWGDSKLAMPIFDPNSTQQFVDQLRQDPPALSRPAPVSEAKWPYLALLGGQGADALTSVLANNSPNLREGNPLGLIPMLGLKAAYTAGLTALMHHQAKNGHPSTAKWLGVMGGLAGAVPAAWNIRQLSR